MAFIADDARAVRVRLTTRAADFETVRDLEQYAETMGNEMRLTPPRVTAVTDTHADLIRLFDKLVGGEGLGRRQRAAVVLPSAINEAFEELKRSNRLFSPGRIVVPILGRRVDIPYAYRNGVVNLIKPTVFEDHHEVEDRAIRLAVEGDFIRENPPPDGARRLIIVSAASQDPSAEDRVAPLFAKYEVPFIRQSGAEEFAARVRREAMPV